jgi:hypothetical protein
LYATGQGHLITLDPTTAAIESVVGPYGISGAFLNALAFHPTTGELYGIDAAHGTLVKASTLTGALATIGSLGTPCCGLSGLAWNLDGSTLYGIDLVDGSFYSIDPATGSATRIGGWTPLGPTDLATDPATGELYAPEWHNYEAVVLTRVRPTNGVRVGVVDVPGTDELEGIAFPPDSMGNRYCSSTSNSTGGAARILPWGTTSASAANLRISAAPVPNRSGLFLHGPSAAQQPFGNGTLCISGRLIHGSAVVATGEHATYVYDASDARHDLSAFVGTTRHFQYWFRDPAAGGAGFDSSDAFSILIRP